MQTGPTALRERDAPVELAGEPVLADPLSQVVTVCPPLMAEIVEPEPPRIRRAYVEGADDPEARRHPSDDHSNPPTTAVWPSKDTHSTPLTTSQIRMVRSVDPVPISPP